jgi:hypothetical protein
MPALNARQYLTQIAEEAALDPVVMMNGTTSQRIIRTLGVITLAGNEPIEIRAHALRMVLETIRHCNATGGDGDAELWAAFPGDPTTLMFFRAALGTVESTRDARDFITVYRD